MLAVYVDNYVYVSLLVCGCTAQATVHMICCDRFKSVCVCVEKSVPKYAWNALDMNHAYVAEHEILNVVLWLWLLLQAEAWCPYVWHHALSYTWYGCIVFVCVWLRLFQDDGKHCCGFIWRTDQMWIQSRSVRHEGFGAGTAGDQEKHHSSVTLRLTYEKYMVISCTWNVECSHKQQQGNAKGPSASQCAACTRGFTPRLHYYAPQLEVTGRFWHFWVVVLSFWLKSSKLVMKSDMRLTFPKKKEKKKTPPREWEV